ncbi:MAG: XRE family transcriptional regulator [Proteobacteria bacterium]|nr:XRE family transcriptional regulator [Pseudomonadota bacterium]
MDLNGLIQKDVAAQAGVKTHAVVSRTIRGSVNNRKVLRALKDLGCPEAYLALPKDMKEEAA